jgi:hypothetical protein
MTNLVINLHSQEFFLQCKLGIVSEGSVVAPSRGGISVLELKVAQHRMAIFTEFAPDLKPTVAWVAHCFCRYFQSHFCGRKYQLHHNNASESAASIPVSNNSMNKQ